MPNITPRHSFLTSGFIGPLRLLAVVFLPESFVYENLVFISPIEATHHREERVIFKAGMYALGA